MPGKITIDEDIIAHATELRHCLHRIPEASMQEKKTAVLVASELRALGYDVAGDVGGTGVVASLKKGSSERAIGLRADMDALPLAETTGLPYAAVNGFMHACGHDGHMAMLLGAAAVIKDMAFDGTVRLVFQPGEEATLGAAAMIEDGLFERFPVDEMYGMHNVPFRPAGTIGMRVGGIMSSEDDFCIKIYGRGCHASMPHQGVDPFMLFSQIYQGLQMIVSRRSDPTHSIVISCTEVHTDGARNAIPSYLEVTGDVRCFRPEDQVNVETCMREISKSICSMYGASCDVTYSHECLSILNSSSCTWLAAEAAEAVVGPDKVDAACEPWMASEDFSGFLQRVPGCYVLLGSGPAEGEGCKLHNTDFDFNDEVLPIGIAYWAELVLRRLS